MIVKVASGRDEVELEQEIQKKLDIASNEGYIFHSSNLTAINVGEYVGSEIQAVNYNCVLFFKNPRAI